MKKIFIAVLVTVCAGCGGPGKPVGGNPSAKDITEDGDTGLLFLDSHNPKSNRHAILEDNGRSCWLYLTEPGRQDPEKDCFVFSPVEPVDKLNIEEVRDNGAPPVLTKEWASPSAVIKSPSSGEFSLVWAEDGESVAVMRRNEPIAMIVRGEKRGYSKALAKSSFLGEPWDESVHAAHFR